MMKYTEEEKKQLKAGFARMLDNEESFMQIEIMEVDGETGTPKIARKRFLLTLLKEGAKENR